jgi:hypothetical protein
VYALIAFCEYLFDCVRVERGVELLLNEKYRKIKGNNCKKWHTLYQLVKPVREKRVETGVWSSVKAESRQTRKRSYSRRCCYWGAAGGSGDGPPRSQQKHKREYRTEREAKTAATDFQSPTMKRATFNEVLSKYTYTIIALQWQW